MKLIYENKKGKVAMDGGDGEGFNIIEIRGLSFPENDMETVYYPNVAGRKVENVTPLERVITLSGDICDKTNKKLERAINVFSHPGTITINSNGKVRKISVRCISFEPNRRRGSFIPFVAQFAADDPYFTDVGETKLYVFRREKMLKTQFSPPCMVSMRKTETDILNRGDGEIEPVFEISSKIGAVCPEGIIIRNRNNGNEIKLLCDVEEDEIITVDVGNRKITSNKRGNFISYMAEETSISRFSLDSDISTVEIIAKDMTGTIYAICRYSNRYLYALI